MKILPLKNDDFRRAGHKELRPAGGGKASAAKVNRDYEVESVVGKRQLQSGGVEYRVQWRGYSEQDQTWEPLSNLKNAGGEVSKYEARSSSSESTSSAPRSKSSAKHGGGSANAAKPKEWEDLWPGLLTKGWCQEDGKRVGQDFYFVPPGVLRAGAGMRVRRDYFDSKLQVRQHLEQHPEEGEEGGEEEDSPTTRQTARGGGSASQLSGLSIDSQWKALVLDCAKKLNRAPKVRTRKNSRSINRRHVYTQEHKRSINRRHVYMR